MISIKHNFIFIHIPKTAGNSIQNILRNYSEDEIVCNAFYQDGKERFEIKSQQFGTTKHSTMEEYNSRLEKEFFESAFKFTCVRNPWDRMISFYFSPHRGVKKWDRDEFISFIHQVPSSLSYLTSDPDNSFQFVETLDYVIKFENLEAGFQDVCEQIGIPYEKLPIRNKATKSHYTGYYDEELVKIVGELFKDEIDLFNYQFE